MIDFKKLHDGFLMHQAILTAAASVANGGIVTANSSSSVNTERKSENSIYNDTSFECSSSTSSLCSNSPNEISSSSLLSDNSKFKEAVLSNDDYQMQAKKIKIEHQENSYKNTDYSNNNNNTDMIKNPSDGTRTNIDLYVESAEELLESPLSITVNSSQSSVMNISPIENTNNISSSGGTKRKFSEYDMSYLIENSNANTVGHPKRLVSAVGKNMKPNSDKQQKSIVSTSNSQLGSLIASPISSSSSCSSISASSTFSPVSLAQTQSTKVGHVKSSSSSFMISDILGLENTNKNGNSSTIKLPQINQNTLIENAKVNNDLLFQQCQLQLQRAFPYLTGLTANQTEFYRLIANTLAIEQHNKSLITPADSSNISLNNLAANYLTSSVSSNPRLISPIYGVSNQQHINVSKSLGPLATTATATSQLKFTNSQINPHTKQVTNTLEKHTPSTPPSANLILSSLEQLTYNQFKDYSSNDVDKNLNDSSCDVISSFSKKLSSCKTTNGSQLSPLSSISSYSRSSSTISAKNALKQVEKRTSSIESNTKIVTKSDTSSSETSLTASNTNNKGTTAEQNGNLWPAWVYCTRYSDRPSAGN